MQLKYLLLLFVVLNGCANRLPLETTTWNYEISRLCESGKQLDTSPHTKNARSLELALGETVLLIHSRDTESVESYYLETAGDISSAVHVSSFSTSTYLGSTHHESNGHGIYIKRGTYDLVWLFNRQEIWQFRLEVPGDMLSAVQTGYFDLAEYVERGHDIDFSLEGDYFYVEDRNQERVHQFKLSEPWNINLPVFDYSLDISAQHEAVRGIEFRPDGRKMYLLDTGLQQLQQYQLDSAWDIRTATLETTFSLDMANPRGFTWNSTGTQAYVMDATSGIITQFKICLE